MLELYVPEGGQGMFSLVESHKSPQNKASQYPPMLAKLRLGDSAGEPGSLLEEVKEESQ